MDTRNYGSTTGSAIGTGSLMGAQIGRPTDAPPESASGIRDAISFGEETLAQLHSVISHLESRLDTALIPLQPTPATTASNGTAPMSAMSHVRERIGNINGGLVDAVQRLCRLRDRVEI